MAFLQNTKIGVAESSAGTTLDLKKIGASDLLDVRYHLDVGGLLLGTFDSLTGGEMEIALVKHDIVYNTGDSTTLFIPGTTSFAPFSLTRGLGNSAELYNWFAAASAGDIIQARRNGSITLNNYVDGEYTPVVRWNFYDAWLTKISGFSSNVYVAAKYASLNITIQAETIERADP